MGRCPLSPGRNLRRQTALPAFGGIGGYVFLKRRKDAKAAALNLAANQEQPFGVSIAITMTSAPPTCMAGRWVD
jgi:hypothetical protein